MTPKFSRHGLKHLAAWFSGARTVLKGQVHPQEVVYLTKIVNNKRNNKTLG